MATKIKNKKIPDSRVIFLLIVFIGLPITVFINWLVTNNEAGTLLKMLVIGISAVVVTVVYRAIRYLFTVKTNKLKMNFLVYILVQSITLIITLIIIGSIVFCLKII